LELGYRRVNEDGCRSLNGAGAAAIVQVNPQGRVVNTPRW